MAGKREARFARRPGHPRPSWATERTWIPGTRPGMTAENAAWFFAMRAS